MSKEDLKTGLVQMQILKHTQSLNDVANDLVVIEAPLEIRIRYNNAQQIPESKNIATTMRTPGDDKALAIGFLFTEGILKSYEDVALQFKVSENVVTTTLKDGVSIDIKKLERNFYINSSCGICGKSSIDQLSQTVIHTPLKSTFRIKKSKLFDLQTQLLNQQLMFNQTGGNHAAALFDKHSNLLFVKEDVGRHNAMDKLIGEAFTKLDLPLSEYLLLLSGRASFELIQKAAMTGIPIVVAVGAPSSLAVELAQEQGICLIGFLKDNGFNIYSNHERILS